LQHTTKFSIRIFSNRVSPKTVVTPTLSMTSMND
jgi:hypothetical protein